MDGAFNLQGNPFTLLRWEATNWVPDKTLVSAMHAHEQINQVVASTTWLAINIRPASERRWPPQEFGLSCIKAFPGCLIIPIVLQVDFGFKDSFILSFKSSAPFLFELLGAGVTVLFDRLEGC